MSLLCLAITLDIHESILTFFGKSITEKVGNQKVVYLPTSSTYCFCATTWGTENPEIASFQLNAACFLHETHKKYHLVTAEPTFTVKTMDCVQQTGPRKRA